MRSRIVAFGSEIWHNSAVPVFLERFILPVFTAIVILLAVSNPMGFDKTQRITGAMGIIFLAYFVAHTVHRYNESKKTPSPESEPFKGKLVSPEDIPKLPGGPGLKRPLFVGQVMQSRWAHQSADAPSMAFMNVHITNRGEASPVKDWQLFVERSGKPDFLCFLYPIPKELNIIENGKAVARFTSDMSIVENRCADKIEHGTVCKGWILFMVPKDILLEVLKGHGKMRLEYHDYLENKYAMTFDFKEPPTPLSPPYVPGSKNPETQ